MTLKCDLNLKECLDRNRVGTTLNLRLLVQFLTNHIKAEMLIIKIAFVTSLEILIRVRTHIDLCQTQSKLIIYYNTTIYRKYYHIVPSFFRSVVRLVLQFKLIIVFYFGLVVYGRVENVNG